MNWNERKLAYTKSPVVFDSLIMPLFTFAIQVWACTYDGKYLAQIDQFLSVQRSMGTQTNV